MSLPKIQHPVFEVFLKSLDKNVRFRPFLVKEEKILLMAADSKDGKAIVDAIKQVINNCCIDAVNVDNLPMFDVQMLFAHIRMKSVGETVSLFYNCTKDVDDKPCNHKNELNIDLKNLSYETDGGHSNIIKLSDTIGVRMNYPVLDNFDALEEYTVDDASKIIAKYVDYIFDQDQVYGRDSFTNQELLEFIENLSKIQIDSLLSFFTSSPKVVLKSESTCEKCGQVNNIYSEDIFDFFL